MKQLFAGKKRLITIPIVILGLTFFPFAIAALSTWFVNKKITNKKVKYSLFTVIGLFTLIFGSAWVAAMSAPSTPPEKKEEQVTKVDRNEPQATKPNEPTTEPSIFKAKTAANNPNLILAKVTAVIDGDTIDVDLGEGNIKRVRYVGVDTPESVDSRQPIQCFSKEATAKNKELVENKIVGLEKDVSETDRYGRLLRYVYVGDLMINYVLVAEGYASAVSYPPDVKYQDKLRQAEHEARAANKGLWGACKTTTPKPTVKPNTSTGTTNNNTATSTITDGSACKYSCSGPDRDCSDFSSHSEAQAFFNCCGFTAHNDPMKLDAVGVGDGIACENI